jgi:hypothetical protein
VPFTKTLLPGRYGAYVVLRVVNIGYRMRILLAGLNHQVVCIALERSSVLAHEITGPV